MHEVSIKTKLISGVVLAVGKKRIERGAVILMYHGVVERTVFSELETYAVSVAILKEHLTFLRRRHEIVPLARIVEALRNGCEPDSRWVALTFDDALKTQVTLGASVLSECSAPWALAVPSRLIGTGRSIWSYELALLLTQCWDRSVLTWPGEAGIQWPMGSVREKQVALAEFRSRLFTLSPSDRMLVMDRLIEQVGETRFLEQLHAYGNYALADWSDLAKLSGEGVEMLSHGAAHHPLSGGLLDSEWKTELEESKQQIEKGIGRTIHGLALPHGVKDEVLEAHARAAGYDVCLTSFPGRVQEGCESLALPRFDAAYPLIVLRRNCLG